MIRRTILGLFLAAGLAQGAVAQDPRNLDIRTFTLRNLRPADAAKLLSPYVLSPGGGVFEAGGTLGAITVRETFTTLTLIDSLLKVHDKARAVVAMRFKLIAAVDSAVRDPAIADVDAELRRLFRFGGYELIGEGTMLSEEMTEFMTTIATKPLFVRDGGGGTFTETFRVRGWMDGITGTGSDRSIRVQVTVQDAATDNELMRTGLTLPIGQTIILGSAKPSLNHGKRNALILIVTPEIAR